jgi:hypothetical protein
MWKIALSSSHIDGPNKSKVVKKFSNTEMKVPFISQ